MDEKLRAAAHAWLAEDPDPDTRAELQQLLDRGDEEQLRDRFGMSLEFGTAGLRGVIGAGPNRFNRSVVIRTTAGLARYLLDTVPDAKQRGVVIGYDGRRLSRESAQDTAAVLAGHGIPAKVYAQLAPTPLTAFTVTHVNAAAGVMVTASHNPPEYNGYKVYWGNGAQIVPPHDKGISAAIDRVGPIPEIPRMEEAQARAKGLWQDLGDQEIEAYFEAIRALSRSQKGRDQLTVVYTPLHGVGGPLATRALREYGFTKVHVVEEQMEPDMRFPTVRFPNPEEPGAMDLSLALARRTNADVVLANDPDADRLAVAVRRPDGSYKQFSGNQIGAVMAAYLMQRDAGGGERAVISTIVSTPMVGEMARAFDVHYDEVLTGFKWIANRAMDLKRDRGARFLFGFEEALGYSVGEVCRDKDGVSAAAIFAEIAADAKARGRDAVDELDDLYRRFGVYVSRQHSATMKGAEGQAQIARIMDTFRKAPPKAIGGLQVRTIRDYKTGVITQAGGGAGGKLDLPSSNVLAFELEGGTRVIARPSGTEPKIKYYFDLREPVREGEAIEAAERRANGKLDALERDFVEQARAAAGA